MYKAMLAYRLKDSDVVVTKRSHIRNTRDSDFEIVRLIISEEEIREWAEEAEEIVGGA